MKNGISHYFPVLSTLQSISLGGKSRIFPPGKTGGGIYMPTLTKRGYSSSIKLSTEMQRRLN